MLCAPQPRACTCSTTKQHTAVMYKRSRSLAASRSDICYATRLNGCQDAISAYWAARYNTWLLIKLTPKGVVFSFLFNICIDTSCDICMYFYFLHLLRQLVSNQMQNMSAMPDAASVMNAQIVCRCCILTALKPSSATDVAYAARRPVGASAASRDLCSPLQTFSWTRMELLV